jgi:hypothetical protein
MLINIVASTEWGYIQTGSGVPKDQLPLIPRVIDVEYLTNICRLAFNISKPADVERINQYGGFNLSYPRLALIVGFLGRFLGVGQHSYAT